MLVVHSHTPFSFRETMYNHACVKVGSRSAVSGSFTRRSSRRDRGCIGWCSRGTTCVTNCQRIQAVGRSWWPYNLISFSVFPTESDLWQMLRPTAKAKSPRMVPNIGRSDLPSRAEQFRKKEPTRGRGERVSCTEHGTAGLDGIRQALPDHGSDGASSHALSDQTDQVARSRLRGETPSSLA